MKLSDFKKPFAINRDHAKQLGLCWNCREPIGKRRRSARYCSSACKQSNYRLICKAKTAVAELQSDGKFVTVSPAIAGKSVTNFTVDRTSGEYTAAGGSLSTQGGAS